MTLLSDHSRALLPGRGPLLSAADPHDGAARRRLERAWTRGVLVPVSYTHLTLPTTPYV